MSKVAAFILGGVIGAYIGIPAYNYNITKSADGNLVLWSDKGVFTKCRHIDVQYHFPYYVMRFDDSSFAYTKSLRPIRINSVDINNVN